MTPIPNVASLAILGIFSEDNPRHSYNVIREGYHSLSLQKECHVGEAANSATGEIWLTFHREITM